MVSIIIPTYNDTEEIGNIIKECKKLSFDKEIIVVDDASNIQHKNILKKIKGIKLITQEKNTGKAGAMLNGFNHSNGSIIAFIDADIIGLTTKDLDNLIRPVLKNDYDITISEKGSGLSRYGKYTGISATFTGERVFKRDILERNKDLFKSHGYTIESEMNKRFLGTQKIARVSWPNVKNPSKIRKGTFIGLKDDIKMYNDIQKHIGLKELSRQLEIANNLPVLNKENKTNMVENIKTNIKNNLGKLTLLRRKNL